MQFHKITLLDYSRPIPERAKAREYVGPYTWQPAKPGTGRGFYQSETGLYCDPRGSTFDLRLVWANELLARHGRYPQGYYCDTHQDETITPIVARLPHGRGFLAGWTMGNGMAATIDATIYETPADAAHAAHSMADHDAEKMRDTESSEDE